MRERLQSQEIHRLRDMLDAAGIEYRFIEQPDNDAKKPLTERILNNLFDLSTKESKDLQITIPYPNSTEALLSVVSSFNNALNAGDTLEIAKVEDSPNKPQSGCTAEECFEIIKRFVT